MPHLFEKTSECPYTETRVNTRTVSAVLAVFLSAVMTVLAGCAKSESKPKPQLLSSPECEAQCAAIPVESDRRLAVHDCTALNQIEKEHQMQRRALKLSQDENKAPKPEKLKNLYSSLNKF